MLYGLANTTATLGSFYWLGFETSGLSPDKKRLALLGAQRHSGGTGDIKLRFKEGRYRRLPLTSCSCYLFIRLRCEMDSPFVCYRGTPDRLAGMTLCQSRRRTSSRGREPPSLSLTDLHFISRKGLRDANPGRLSRSRTDAACSRGMDAASGSRSIAHYKEPKIDHLFILTRTSKVMATPLAGANGGRGVGVQVTENHLKQRG